MGIDHRMGGRPYSTIALHRSNRTVTHPYLSILTVAAAVIAAACGGCLVLVCGRLIRPLRVRGARIVKGGDSVYCSERLLEVYLLVGCNTIYKSPSELSLVLSLLLMDAADASVAKFSVSGGKEQCLPLLRARFFDPNDRASNVRWLRSAGRSCSASALLVLFSKVAEDCDDWAGGGVGKS